MSTPTFGFPFPGPTDSVRDGWENIRDLAEATDGYLSGGFLYAGTRYYTSSGVFEKADPFGDGNPTDLVVRAVRVRVVGGGGGGAGAGETTGNGAACGGGGGGGYAESFLLASELGTSETVERGAGGAGGDDGSGDDGNPSSFGTLVVAEGGLQGLRRGISATLFRVASGGTGGLATAGQIQVAGGPGGAGLANTDGDALSGGGGNSFFGGGGRGANALDATSPGQVGGGGSGRSNPPTRAAQTGENGGDGLVIVDVFV